MPRWIILIAFLLTGCAASPFGPLADGTVERTPEQVLAAPDSTGDRVIWGGRIVGLVNRRDRTEIEVLALPLGPGDRPRRQAEGGSRFVIYREGFLEPFHWSPGRFVTVLGRVAGVESRSVGAFELAHPVIEAEALELWPEEPNSSRVGFGFGVGIHL